MPQTMSLDESRSSVLLTRGEISAAQRLRVNNRVDSRGDAETPRNESRHALIQQCTQPWLLPAMPATPPYNARPQEIGPIFSLSPLAGRGSGRGGVQQMLKPEVSPARAAPCFQATLRPVAARPSGSRRGAEAQRILFAATTRHLLTFASREGLREARLPQETRNGFSASTSRKRNPSAPPRLRANKFFCLRNGAAAAQRGERNAGMIQHSAKSLFPTTTTNQNPNPKKYREFPAIPCPAGNRHHPRLATVAA
ncbi:hypothetical protein BH10PSE14_BH10PSE14_27230 [soil metagenome]